MSVKNWSKKLGNLEKYVKNLRKIMINQIRHSRITENLKKLRNSFKCMKNAFLRDLKIYPGNTNNLLRFDKHFYGNCFRNLGKFCDALINIFKILRNIWKNFQKLWCISERDSWKTSWIVLKNISKLWEILINSWKVPEK